VAPAGKTRLFLADLDGLGQHYDNSGQFVVVVSSSAVSKEQSP